MRADEQCIDRQRREDALLFERQCHMVLRLLAARDNPEALERAMVERLPRSLRAEVWLELLGAKDLRRKNPGVYARLLAFSSEQSKRIVRDVGRTYPTHRLFEDGASGQVALLNVLRAYSIFDSELGCNSILF